MDCTCLFMIISSYLSHVKIEYILVENKRKTTFSRIGIYPFLLMFVQHRF